MKTYIKVKKIRKDFLINQSKKILFHDYKRCLLLNESCGFIANGISYVIAVFIENE